MTFIDTLPTAIEDAVRSGRWSSPRSGSLLVHARLVRDAAAAGRLIDDVRDTLAVAARTEIAASASPLPIMTMMLDGLRDWQTSARSAACRGFVEHGGYSDADQALTVARTMLAQAPAIAA